MWRAAGAVLASAWLAGVLRGGEIVVAAASGFAGRPEAVEAADALIGDLPGAVKAAFGNIGRGRAVATAGGGLPVIAALDRGGWSAVVPGRADVSLPAGFLHRWRSGFRGAVMGAQWISGDFRPAAFLVAERGGLRLGIIALGDPGVRSLAERHREVSCRDEIEAVRDALKDPELAGCHGKVLLCRLPVAEFGVLDRLLVSVPEIDAVISAAGRGKIPGRMVRNRLCVQLGSGGAAVLKLHFDAGGRFRFAESRLIGEKAPGGKPDGKQKRSGTTDDGR